MFISLTIEISAMKRLKCIALHVVGLDYRCKLIQSFYSACVGEIDQEIDGNLGLGGIRAEPLQPIVH